MGTTVYPVVFEKKSLFKKILVHSCLIAELIAASRRKREQKGNWRHFKLTIIQNCDWDGPKKQDTLPIILEFFIKKIPPKKTIICPKNVQKSASRLKFTDFWAKVSENKSFVSFSVEPDEILAVSRISTRIDAAPEPEVEELLLGFYNSSKQAVCYSADSAELFFYLEELAFITEVRVLVPDDETVKGQFNSIVVV